MTSAKNFVQYFRSGHERLHGILGKDYCCEKINHLFHDLFLMHAKYYRGLEDYAKLHPIFNNFMAVHVYKGSVLHEEGVDTADMVNTLAYESYTKHKKGECSCGAQPDYNKMLELFMTCVSYSHLTQNPEDEAKLVIAQALEPEAVLLN